MVKKPLWTLSELVAFQLELLFSYGQKSSPPRHLRLHPFLLKPLQLDFCTAQQKNTSDFLFLYFFFFFLTFLCTIFDTFDHSLL